MRCLCLFLLCNSIFTVVCELNNQDLRQARAQVKYLNPNYLTNFEVFTAKASRRSPYLTTVNATSLQAWGNNVSLRVEYSNERQQSIGINWRVCDLSRMQWAVSWVQKYSDIPLDKCPYPPGTYHVRFMELPIKEIPLPMPDNDYKLSLTAFLTNTKTKIAEFSVMLKAAKRKN